MLHYGGVGSAYGRVSATFFGKTSVRLLSNKQLLLVILQYARKRSYQEDADDCLLRQKSALAYSFGTVLTKQPFCLRWSPSRPFLPAGLQPAQDKYKGHRIPRPGSQRPVFRVHPQRGSLEVLPDLPRPDLLGDNPSHLLQQELDTLVPAPATAAIDPFDSSHC